MGTTNFPDGISSPRTVVLAAASQTLTKEQCGTKFVGVVDAVFTLPSAASTPLGTWYEFQCGALSTGTGLSISPNAADAITGAGLTAVLDKDLINTGATDVVGDMVRIYCTGAAGAAAWMVDAIIGTWAKQA